MSPPYPKSLFAPDFSNVTEQNSVHALLYDNMTWPAEFEAQNGLTNGQRSVCEYSWFFLKL